MFCRVFLLWIKVKLLGFLELLFFLGFSSKPSNTNSEAEPPKTKEKSSDPTSKNAETKTTRANSLDFFFQDQGSIKIVFCCLVVLQSKALFSGYFTLKSNRFLFFSGFFLVFSR